MSELGRLCIEHIDRRWAEGQRAAKVHQWERSVILAGDLSPIVRELKPAFTEGQEFVLSWTRRSRTAVYDDLGRLTGEVVVAERLPLCVITIRDVKRHRLGYYRVRFDVLDRREIKRLVRRKPPALREGEYSEASEEEIAEAAVESAYTSNPKQALDYLEAVPAEWDNTFALQATSRFAEHRRRDRAEQQVREDTRRLAATVRDTMLMMVRSGVDPTEYLAQLQRDAQAIEDRAAA